MDRLQHEDGMSGDEVGQLAIENFDYHQNVHHMMEEHQNVDRHYVTVMATENRVTGNDLSDVKLSGSIVERILVANIPYLRFLAGVVTYRIPNKYSMEMSTKSNTVCFEYLFLSKILGFSLSITCY